MSDIIFLYTLTVIYSNVYSLKIQLSTLMALNYSSLKSNYFYCPVISFFLFLRKFLFSYVFVRKILIITATFVNKCYKNSDKRILILSRIIRYAIVANCCRLSNNPLKYNFVKPVV